MVIVGRLFLYIKPKRKRQRHKRTMHSCMHTLTRAHVFHNPIALRKAKIVLYNFGLSECNGVKINIESNKWSRPWLGKFILQTYKVNNITAVLFSDSHPSVCGPTSSWNFCPEYNTLCAGNCQSPTVTSLMFGGY